MSLIFWARRLEWEIVAPAENAGRKSIKLRCTASITGAKSSGRPRKNTVWKDRVSSIERRNAPKIVLIGGPTASGKSSLALEIAREVGCEIINADSRQIYRHLSIGTSQPDLSDLQKIPHHLYSFLEPSEAFTAADFERRSSDLMVQIASRGRLPLVVGGTGFYMRALLRGVWPVAPKNEELRNRIRSIHSRRGAFFVHKMLMRIDRESAANIAPQDTYRMVRALEIFFQSGIQRSRLARKQEERFCTLKYYLEPGREMLHRNIEERTDQMFSRGWVEEVNELMKLYPGFEEMPAAKSLGYFEILQHLNGRINLEQCKALINLRTRQYAKRQLTWFRNQDHFERVRSEEPLRKIIDSVLQWYRT
jgi:tRNA dimethylallyltransferase